MTLYDWYTVNMAGKEGKQGWRPQAHRPLAYGAQVHDGTSTETGNTEKRLLCKKDAGFEVSVG